MTAQGAPSRRWPTDPDIDDRAIHPQDFAPLHEQHRFTVDAAAAHHNARLPRYWTIADNGLEQPWAGERVWCNPPFSDLAPWVAKAWTEHRAADLIVMLVPANRTEQRWRQYMIEPYRDRPGSPLTTDFRAGRWRFLRPGQTSIGPGERPPMGICILTWQHHAWTPDTITGGIFSR